MYSCLCNSKLLLLDISLSFYSSIAQIRDSVHVRNEEILLVREEGVRGPALCDL